MEDRKKFILFIIIKEHIRSKMPVGSSVLVEKYNLEISPATVRNIMADLENDDFIVQPYTSAGRTPTEKAFRFYVNSFFPELANDTIGKVLKKKETDELSLSLKDSDEFGFKKTAKLIADISDSAVFWAFNQNNLYYTGISNLLKQPEFYQTGSILDISVVIDRMDEIINEIFEDTRMETSVLIGSTNPFGDFCSTVLSKYKIGKKKGLFGILGPLRMDYKKNISLVNYIFNKINK